MNEFDGMLRQWRDRISPEQAGVATGGRRRAAGLRREEVARLAGISVDYLTRLEQGRATAPSAQVVEALARALRLSSVERERLFLGAGMPAPGPGVVPTHVAPSVQRLLDRLAGTPVVVFDAAWNLIQANAPYDALMGDTTRLRGNDRNALWRQLVGSGTRARQSDQEREEQLARMVASLRLTVAKYPADGQLRRLVDELLGASALFRELWGSATDAPIADQSRHKTIDHPVVGPVEVDCDVLVVTDDDLRIMVYTTEPGSDAAAKLELAVVVGAQELAGRA